MFFEAPCMYAKSRVYTRMYYLFIINGSVVHSFILLVSIQLSITKKKKKKFKTNTKATRDSLKPQFLLYSITGWGVRLFSFLILFSVEI